MIVSTFRRVVIYEVIFFSMASFSYKERVRDKIRMGLIFWNSIAQSSANIFYAILDSSCQ